MKEYPLICTAADVRAILAGTKTQDRRVMKPQPAHWTRDEQGRLWPAILVRVKGEVVTGAMRCPLGVPGDRLWVREAHRLAKCSEPAYWFREDDHCDWDGDEFRTIGLAVQYKIDGDILDDSDDIEDDCDRPLVRSHYQTWDDVLEAYGLGQEPEYNRWRSPVAMPRWACRVVLEVVDVGVELDAKVWNWVRTFKVMK